MWFAHAWFRTRSTVLCAFMHAAFNGNFCGVWNVLFVSPDKLLIGPAGIIGAVLTLILGLFYLWKIPERGESCDSARSKELNQTKALRH